MARAREDAEMEMADSRLAENDAQLPSAADPRLTGTMVGKYFLGEIVGKGLSSEVSCVIQSALTGRKYN